MITNILPTALRILTTRAHAQISTGSFGIEAESGTLTIRQIGQNILAVGVGTISVVCAAVFIAGAFFLASSAGNDQRKSLGKDLMIGAVMGIAIVAGAGVIINLTYSFIYAS